MKSLKKCCNGCDKPPQPPSKVLCEDCFAKLDQKMQNLSQMFPEKAHLLRLKK